MKKLTIKRNNGGTTVCLLFLKYFTAILLSGVAFNLCAQNQANIWYSGTGAGLNFNFNPPVPMEDGNIGLMGGATGEGAGAISDENGNLLFYTNGETIYTNTHVAMPNGDGLNGNGTTTQTGLIIPVNGNPDQYFVISSSDGGAVKYVIVDMTLNGGLGDVVIASKAGTNGTTLLASPKSEGALAIPEYTAANVPTNEYWVIFHGTADNNYYVFKTNGTTITSQSTQAVGFTPPGQPVMMMKTNSCFDKIANAFYNAGRVEVLPFNNVTGVISAPTLVLNGIGVGNPFLAVEVYGVEFSPSGRFLYVTEAGLDNRRTVFQFDISLGTGTNPAAVLASRRYFTGDATVNRFGAAQLGPDGKIYVPGYTTTPPGYLSVIPNPDVAWTTTPALATEFEFKKYTFYSKRVGEGLPPVLKNLLTSVRILYNNACEGGTTNFSYVFGGGAASQSWDFGDPLSGSNNTSTALAPSHTYATAGTYTVTLTIIDNCGRERTGTVDVIIKEGPKVSIPANLCANTNITLTGTGTNAASYIWSLNSNMSLPSGPSSTYLYNGILPRTIYVQDPTPLATYVAGNTTAAASASGDARFTYFELFTTVTITSFQGRARQNIISSDNLSIGIESETGATNYWQQNNVVLVNGTTYTYSPGIILGPGKYRFYSSVKDPFFRNTTNIDGARDVPGVIDISGDHTSATRGGFAFNVSLSLADPCGIRAYTLTDNCPLPVDWLSFTAKPSANKSYLNWKLSKEENNSHFVIQRSHNAEDYEDIGIVYGRGNSNYSTAYSFIDEEPAVSSYYRIKQVDYNGDFTYSKTEYVNFNNNGITVAPNPFNEELTISFASDDAADITVFDVTGRIVYKAEKNTGENSFVLGSTLPAGAYIVQVNINDQIQTVLIVKE